MKYLCLVYEEEAKVDALLEHGSAAIADENLHFSALPGGGEDGSRRGPGMNRSDDVDQFVELANGVRLCYLKEALDSRKPFYELR